MNKRLCSMGEWQTACKGSCGYKYPYGDEFEGSACNGFGANPEGADFWETGKRARCSTPSWVYDLVGNAREWTSTQVEDGVYAIVGGSPKDEARSILSCAGEDFKSDAPENPPSFVGFRCCAD
jgi:formylglycine-generating enzyme required for sulfatase activity